MKLITIAKETQPQAVTMLGGSHGTFWDENALNEYPSLDIVVRREGEQTFIELLDKLQNQSQPQQRVRHHISETETKSSATQTDPSSKT